MTSFHHKYCLLYIAVASCIILVLFACCGVMKRYLSFHGAAFLCFGRRTRRGFPSDSNPDEPSTQTQSTGLASAVVCSLPALQFRKDVRGEGDGGGDDECAICLRKFHRGEWLRLLPNCAHVFHVPCVDTWFRSHSTCPLCRTSVLCDFSDLNSSASVVALLETLQREEVPQERSLGYRLLQLQIMRNPEFRMGAMGGHPIESESDESFQGLVSPAERPSNQRQTVENLLRLTTYDNHGSPLQGT